MLQSSPDRLSVAAQPPRCRKRQLVPSQRSESEWSSGRSEWVGSRRRMPKSRKYASINHSHHHVRHRPSLQLAPAHRHESHAVNPNARFFAIELVFRELLQQQGLTPFQAVSSQKLFCQTFRPRRPVSSPHSFNCVHPVHLHQWQQRQCRNMCCICVRIDC